jgi:hypothetical protein
MKLKTALCAALVASSLSGCATVVNGTNQKYQIETNPKGATVSLLNGESCVSPCRLKLKRRFDTRADIALQGYKPTYVLIRSKAGGASAGNLLLGGIVGVVVDGSNGSNRFLSPSPLKVRLAAIDSNEESTLLDKEGKRVSSVDAYNDKVRNDVAKFIGPEAAGMPVASSDQAVATSSATTTPVPATPTSSATAAPAPQATSDSSLSTPARSGSN